MSGRRAVGAAGGRPPLGEPIGLLWSAEGPFATGRCAYSNRPHGRERLNRVFVPLVVGGTLIEAVVDTGGAYLILEPDVAVEAGLTPSAAFAEERIRIRGGEWPGALHRVDVTLVTDEPERGADLMFNVTAFVPELDQGERWPLPPYLGWDGGLERLRVAIDPSSDLLYFGPA